MPQNAFGELTCQGVLLPQNVLHLHLSQIQTQTKAQLQVQIASEGVLHQLHLLWCILLLAPVVHLILVQCLFTQLLSLIQQHLLCCILLLAPVVHLMLLV